MSPTVFKLAARRHQVAELYLQQRYQTEIARRVGVSQQVVNYDLKVILKAWRASDIRDFDAAKEEELQRLNLLERECWEAWDKSKQPKEITFTEAVEGMETIIPNGARQSRQPTRKASVRREGQTGDPRFLERIQKCIEQRCEILGLGAKQEALKQAGEGLAALLEQARLAHPALSLPSAPMVDA